MTLVGKKQNPAKNLIRCQGPGCHRTEEWDGTDPPDGRKSWPCPEPGCSSFMSFRCGWTKADETRCLKKCKQGEVCDTHAPGGRERAARKLRSASKAGAKNSQSKKLNKSKMIPGNAGPPPGGHVVVVQPKCVAPAWQVSYNEAERDPRAAGRVKHSWALLAAMLDERVQMVNGQEDWQALQAQGKKADALLEKIKEHTKANDRERATAAIQKLCSLISAKLLPMIFEGAGTVNIRREIRGIIRDQTVVLKAAAECEAHLTPSALGTTIERFFILVLEAAAETFAEEHSELVVPLMQALQAKIKDGGRGGLEFKGGEPLNLPDLFVAGNGSG